MTYTQTFVSQGSGGRDVQGPDADGFISGGALFWLVDFSPSSHGRGEEAPVSVLFL